jgi:hypothetical protein
MEKSPYENLNTRGSKLDKREKPRSSELDLRSQEEIDEAARLNQKDWKDSEGVVDTDDSFETFGESKEEEEDDLGGIVTEEEVGNVEAEDIRIKREADLDRMEKKAALEIADIDREATLMKELQQDHPERDEEPFRQSMTGHILGSEKIDRREIKDFKKRQTSWDNQKTEKKKDDYRADNTEKVAAKKAAKKGDKKGFFGKVLNMFKSDDNDQNKAA